VLFLRSSNVRHSIFVLPLGVSPHAKVGVHPIASDSGSVYPKISRHNRLGLEIKDNRGERMKQKAIYRIVFAAAVAAIFAIGPQPGASESDDRIIESLFQKTHVYRTYLKDDAIKADARDGVVTLEGSVIEESHKLMAQDILECLPGVIRVDNKLAIKAGDSPESPDIRIRRKVNLALLFNRNVNFNKTAVEVKDGVVTLKGEASSMAQKELAAEYARDIEGVKEVKNEMAVVAAPEPKERTEEQKIDDASVTAQVRTALQTHRSTSAVRTKIVVRDGDVTLTGIARNDAEKVLVTKLVNDIHGVATVKNMMTVEEAGNK